MKRAEIKKKKLESMYKAFTDLVNEVGYEDLTTRQVAKKAGVSIGTVYYYFPDGKASIAAGLYERVLAEQLEGMSLDLRTQISRSLALHKEYKELYRAFDQAIYARKSIFHGIKLQRDSGMQDEIEESAIRMKDVLLMNGMVDALIHRHLFIEPMFETDEEFIEYMTSMATASYSFSQENT